MIHTPDTFIAAVTAHAKTNKWLNGTFQVEHAGRVHAVGIKSYGLWVQRLEVCGIRADVPEQKTQKVFKAELKRALDEVFASLGAVA